MNRKVATTFNENTIAVPNNPRTPPYSRLSIVRPAPPSIPVESVLGRFDFNGTSTAALFEQREASERAKNGQQGSRDGLSTQPQKYSSLQTPCAIHVPLRGFVLLSEHH